MPGLCPGGGLKFRVDRRIAFHIVDKLHKKRTGRSAVEFNTTGFKPFSQTLYLLSSVFVLSISQVHIFTKVGMRDGRENKYDM